jgi:hypothetical protein
LSFFRLTVAISFSLKEKRWAFYTVVGPLLLQKIDIRSAEKKHNVKGRYLKGTQIQLKPLPRKQEFLSKVKMVLFTAKII